MRIVCIGDSLTEGDYGVFGKSGIANVHPENYPYFLSQLMDCEVSNCGKCGFTSSSYLKMYREGKVDVHDADAVLLMLGTNGGLDPDGDTQGNRDYDTLVGLIRRDAPQARLILLTPPHVTVNPAFSNCGYLPRVEAAVGFTRAYAAAHDLPLIDAAAFPDFTAETEAVYQANDGLHFVEAGYRRLAERIAEALRPLLGH